MGSWVLTDGAGVCTPRAKGLHERGLQPGCTGTSPVEGHNFSQHTSFHCLQDTQLHGNLMGPPSQMRSSLTELSLWGA